LHDNFELYFWRSKFGNVGDDLNTWLWPRILDCDFHSDGNVVLIGIGSVLDERHDTTRRKLVLGAGARSETSALTELGDDWEIRFVRGPRTANAMNLSSSLAVSDPAIVVPKIYREPRKNATARPKKIGFVPYWKTDIAYASIIANVADIQLIPVHCSYDKFIDMLLECDAVVAEAMHGAILADAYGIPWIPCRISNLYSERETHDFKWQDWAMSLDIRLPKRILTLPQQWHHAGFSLNSDMKLLLKARAAARRIDEAIESGGWILSDRDILASKQRQILEICEEVKQTLSCD
jgi:succinoglycan biosynthesis protein ExoV